MGVFGAAVLALGCSSGGTTRTGGASAFAGGDDGTFARPDAAPDSTSRVPSGGSVPEGATPITLAATGAAPALLAADANDAYWAEADGIHRVHLDGTSRERLVATEHGPITGLVLDDTNIYWAEQGDPANGDGFVKRMPKAGGRTLVMMSEQWSPHALAIDAHSLYWSNRSSFDVAVLRLDLATWNYYGIAREMDADAIVSDDTNVFVRNGSWMIVDAAESMSTYDFWSLSVGGAIAVDATSVYAYDSVARAIVKLDKSTLRRGTGSRARIVEAQSVRLIAVDAASLYWAEQSSVGGDRLRTIAKSGGAARDLADDADIGQLVVTGNGVLWTTDHAVRMLPKP